MTTLSHKAAGFSVLGGLIFLKKSSISDQLYLLFSVGRAPSQYNSACVPAMYGIIKMYAKRENLFECIQRIAIHIFIQEFVRVPCAKLKMWAVILSLGQYVILYSQIPFVRKLRSFHSNDKRVTYFACNPFA